MTRLVRTYAHGYVPAAAITRLLVVDNSSSPARFAVSACTADAPGGLLLTPWMLDDLAAERMLDDLAAVIAGPAGVIIPAAVVAVGREG